MSSRDIHLNDPCPSSPGPSRRRLLLGLGTLAVAPAAALLTPSTAAAATPVASRDARAAAEIEPECLADLIEMGVVDRGDLVAR